MGWPVRTLRTLMALVVVTLIAAPLVPGAVGRFVGDQLRRVSVLQSWRMYAPDPQRAQSYLSLQAELADGTMVPLVEAVEAEHGWGSVWDWQKRRDDIWWVFASGAKPSQHRTWYMRGVCVREDRARGAPPRRIVGERVRRTLTHPDAVAQGQPGLSNLHRSELQTVRCDEWPARGMIAADRARRGLAPPEKAAR